MAGYQYHVVKPIDAGEEMAVVAMLTGKTASKISQTSMYSAAFA